MSGPRKIKPLNLKSLPNVVLNKNALDTDTVEWLQSLDAGAMERHTATLVAWHESVYPKLVDAYAAREAFAALNLGHYEQIAGKLSAEDAADNLVFHAQNIADSIKRNDNAAFGPRVSSAYSLLVLLNQYVAQKNPEYTSSTLECLAAAGSNPKVPLGYTYCKVRCEFFNARGNIVSPEFFRKWIEHKNDFPPYVSPAYPDAT